MRGLFVTGTDTDCGKTLVSVALLNALAAQGRQVAGFKPIAAGAMSMDGELQNADALALADASTVEVPYRITNPYCFEPPIAPHIAAGLVGVTIDPERLLAAATELAGKADLIVAEGAGGWRVPLHGEFDIQALARLLQLPVILVVGLKLGCLNHALLTADAIQSSGQTLFGWIATQAEPDMSCFDENVTTLRERIDAPCLGVIPHVPGADADAVLAQLDMDRLSLV